MAGSKANLDQRRAPLVGRCRHLGCARVPRPPVPNATHNECGPVMIAGPEAISQVSAPSAWSIAISFIFNAVSSAAAYPPSSSKMKCVLEMLDLGNDIGEHFLSGFNPSPA